MKNYSRNYLTFFQSVIYLFKKAMYTFNKTIIMKQVLLLNKMGKFFHSAKLFKQITSRQDPVTDKHKDWHHRAHINVKNHP